ncbi:hypothetical protein BDN67DRAFT_913130, partial [Paxillus ammoniavirescens]
PHTYDGAASSTAFHRFMTEGTVYIEDRQVAEKKKVFILSHYLKVKLYEFYTREVSIDPYHWRLKPFFSKLFSSCFPIDFHLQQHDRLKRCYQNQCMVCEFVSELTEI